MGRKWPGPLGGGGLAGGLKRAEVQISVGRILQKKKKDLHFRGKINQNKGALGRAVNWCSNVERRSLVKCCCCGDFVVPNFGDRQQEKGTLFSVWTVQFYSFALLVPNSLLKPQ